MTTLHTLGIIPTLLQGPIKCVTVSTATQLLQLKTAHIVHSCEKTNSELQILYSLYFKMFVLIRNKTADS